MKNNNKILKRFGNTTVCAALLLTAACLFNGCTQKTDAPAASAASETEASGTEAAEMKTASEMEKAENTENTFPVLDVEIGTYKRVYPSESDQIFSASCETIAIQDAGYEKLNTSLKDYNIIAQDRTDYFFEETSRGFMETELSDFEKAMLPYSLESFISISRKDTNVLSFISTESDWLGGAHPTSFQNGHNYDAQTGERLDIRSVAADYDRLYEKVVTELEKAEEDGAFFDEWKETVEDTFKQTKVGYEVNYLMTPQGITIIFNPYEIAPYASGPQFIDISYKDDPELLNGKYFPDELEAAYQDQNFSMWDSGKVQVEDLLKYTSTDTDAEVYYSFHLPYLYGPETDDIKKANEEIDSLRKKYVDPAMKIVENKESDYLEVNEVSYKATRYKGIFSVLVVVYGDCDMTEYYSWNFDEDGNKAENADVFRLYGMTEEEFLKVAEKQISEETDYGAYTEDEELKKEFEEMHKNTMKNVSADMPVYIDSDNSLNTYCTVYTPAGAGQYEGVFKLKGTEHRPDGRREVIINPQNAENLVKDGKSYYIRDIDDAQKYVLDDNTLLNYGLPAFAYGMKPVEWCDSYLGQSDSGSGFSMGDTFYIIVDEDQHIDMVEHIYYWD